MKTLRLLVILLIGVLVSSCNETNIPKNLEECFVELDTMLPDSIKESMKSLTEDEFTAKMHKNQGLWIRNNWGLRKGSRLSAYFYDLGIYNADDMTGIIFTSYYRNSTGQEINLEKQVDHYQNYWKVVEKPTEEIYPPEVKNLKFNSYYDYNSKHYEIGAVHIGTTSNPEVIWLYDYYLGWKKINQAELDRLDSNLVHRENILHELYGIKH